MRHGNRCPGTFLRKMLWWVPFQEGCCQHCPGSLREEWWSPHSNWKTSREKVFERTVSLGRRELRKWCEAFTCRGCVILTWSANSRPVGMHAPGAWDRRRQHSLLSVQETSPGVQCCDSAAVGSDPFCNSQVYNSAWICRSRPCQQHKAPVA